VTGRRQPGDPGERDGQLVSAAIVLQRGEQAAFLLAEGRGPAVRPRRMSISSPKSWPTRSGGREVTRMGQTSAAQDPVRGGRERRDLYLELVQGRSAATDRPLLFHRATLRPSGVPRLVRPNSGPGPPPSRWACRRPSASLVDPASGVRAPRPAHGGDRGELWVLGYAARPSEPVPCWPRAPFVLLHFTQTAPVPDGWTQLLVVVVVSSWSRRGPLDRANRRRNRVACVSIPPSPDADSARSDADGPSHQADRTGAGGVLGR
jgi:hypothetical protein